MRTGRVSLIFFAGLMAGIVIAIGCSDKSSVQAGTAYRDPTDIAAYLDASSSEWTVSRVSYPGYPSSKPGIPPETLPAGKLTIKPGPAVSTGTYEITDGELLTGILGPDSGSYELVGNNIVLTSDNILRQTIGAPGGAILGGMRYEAGTITCTGMIGQLSAFSFHVFKLKGVPPPAK